VVARHQLLALGLTPAQTLTEVEARRWQRAYPGVYATFTGDLPSLARVWAALLHAGPGAAAAGRTALWLAGLPAEPATVSVAVPTDRKVRRQPGMTVHRVRNLEPAVHPAAVPRRLRVEPALLQLTARTSTPDQVADLVIRVCQHRLTTAARLRAELGRMARHRWRPLLADLLAEVEDGVRSALERRWLHRVERAHGLPPARRDQAERAPDGSRRYRDLRYHRWAVVIELDGREAHPDEEAFRDRARDNRAARSGELALTYGWREVASDPCGIAAEVGAVLTTNGWSGRLRRCGATCTLPTR
jgi:hypothetical protein